MRQEFERDPGSILYRAVYGMLPKNNLRKVCAVPPAALQSQILKHRISSHLATSQRFAIDLCTTRCGCRDTRYARQARALKLRIYPDAEHPFGDDPRLVKLEPPPRQLRVTEPLLELPEGFEPLNQAAYRKRFGHMLPREMVEELRSGTPAVTSIPAEQSQ